MDCQDNPFAFLVAVVHNAGAVQTDPGRWVPWKIQESLLAHSGNWPSPPGSRHGGFRSLKCLDAGQLAASERWPMGHIPGGPRALLPASATPKSRVLVRCGPAGSAFPHRMTKNCGTQFGNPAFPAFGPKQRAHGVAMWSVDKIDRVVGF